MLVVAVLGSSCASPPDDIEWSWSFVDPVTGAATPCPPAGVTAVVIHAGSFYRSEAGGGTGTSTTRS